MPNFAPLTQRFIEYFQSVACRRLGAPRILPSGPAFVAALLLAGSSGCGPQSNSAPVDQPKTEVDYSAPPGSTQNGGGERSTPAQPTNRDAAPPKNSATGKSPADPGAQEPHPGAQRFHAAHRDAATACADLHCYAFDSPRSALRAVIDAYAPRIVSFGEAHAPNDYSGKSTVRRFTDDLLPELASSSSFLTVEILAPPKDGCAQAEQQARRESEQITSGQSENNQNEYVALGIAARAAGIRPDILRASCADLRAIAAPQGGVLAYMETIARLFAHDLHTIVPRVSEKRPLVLTYGGALHNDVVPRPGRESWSFAPAALDLAQGRYLEIDLIVPALIRDTDAWTAFAWYDAYRASEKTDATLVIPWGAHSVALIFPSRDLPGSQ